MTEPTPDPKTLPRILIVDDEEKNRRLLETLLRSDYETRSAADGMEALDTVREFRPDLVLLDVMMPRLNGFDTTRELKRDPDTKNIPVVLLTSLDDRASRLHGLAAGAEEFLTKPIDRAELQVRVRNLLRIKSFNDLLAEHNRILEERVRARTAQLRSSYRDAIHAMTAAIEYKDEGTGAHIKRISRYTATLARTLGLGEEFAETMFYASPMHDVGKIGVPDNILLKAGPLTEPEWEIMRTHTLLGERILSGGDSPYLRMGADIAAAHHERWDGSGYPRQLRGEAIPLSARIMTLCDQYDALRSARPYKSAIDHEHTVQVLVNGDGRTMPDHFDPQVLAAFLNVHGEFNEIYESGNNN